MSTARVKTRDCPVCGRGFLKGRRCYVPTKDGRLIRKLVCYGCSSKAERIVVKVSARPCMTPACANLAHVCSHCAAAMVLEVRQSAVSNVVAQLRAILLASRMTMPGKDAEAVKDWNEGRLEGLRAALSMLLNDGTKKGAA